MNNYFKALLNDFENGLVDCTLSLLFRDLYRLGKK